MDYGATGGTRTHDRLITNQLLYQLSYGGDKLDKLLKTLHLCSAQSQLRGGPPYNSARRNYPAKNRDYKRFWVGLSREKIDEGAYDGSPVRATK